MKRVIIESPYAGDIERNINYARMCVKDSLKRGEAPIASHLLYTQDGILDDTIPEQRRNGIEAGLAWVPVADIHAFYVDLGVSDGMHYAIDRAKANGWNYEMRQLFPKQEKSQQSRKEQLKGKFRPRLIEIQRNLDYKDGCNGLYSGERRYTVLCPEEHHDMYFDHAWILWNNRKVRLEDGEYVYI